MITKPQFIEDLKLVAKQVEKLRKELERQHQSELGLVTKMWLRNLEGNIKHQIVELEMQ